MIRLILLISVLFLFTNQEFKLVKTRISDNITARLPSDFYLLPPDELQSKSVSYRMPIAYYTNPDKQVDFSVNNSASRWQERDLELLKEIYQSNIRNLFDNVEFINQKIQQINGRDFIVFEFYGTVQPGESLFRQENSDRKFYYIQYTLKGNQIFIFTFSAPIQQKDKWEDAATAIMQSIKIN